MSKKKAMQAEVDASGDDGKAKMAEFQIRFFTLQGAVQAAELAEKATKEVADDMRLQLRDVKRSIEILGRRQAGEAGATPN